MLIFSHLDGKHTQKFQSPEGAPPSAEARCETAVIKAGCWRGTVTQIHGTATQTPPEPLPRMVGSGAKHNLSTHGAKQL